VWKAAELAEDVQLQAIRHAGAFGRARGIKNYLKRAHRMEIKG